MVSAIPKGKLYIFISCETALEWSRKDKNKPWCVRLLISRLNFSRFLSQVLRKVLPGDVCVPWYFKGDGIDELCFHRHGYRFRWLKYRSHCGIISFGTMIIKTSIKSALPTPCIPVHVRPPERILIFPLRARSVGSPRVHAPPGMCNCAVPAPLYAGHVPRRVRVMPGASSSLMSSSAVDVIWTNSCEPIIRFLVCKRPSCALNLRYFGNQVYPDSV